MSERIESIEGGSATSPRGFKASGVAAGIKKSGALDLGLLVSQARCAAAGVFTQNRLKGASLLVSREYLEDGHAQAVIVNSGNANACTGERGLLDAREMSRAAARLLQIPAHDVLPSSTGVIGEYLPLANIRQAVPQLTDQLSENGGPLLARAMMTTDTVPKHAARKVSAEGRTFTLGGVAKGAGMIHPNMATMLCFLTTDARVGPEALRSFLKRAVDNTFNRFTIDGDTSCDDTVLLMSNGLSDSTELRDDDSPAAQAFYRALSGLCMDLTMMLARDGEGVTKTVSIIVKGAPTREDADKIAKAIAISPLVKTALHGEDPNWGRIINAAGYAGAEFDPSKADITIGGIRVMLAGERAVYAEADAHAAMKAPEFSIELNLNQGVGEAFYITTDFSNAYIDINADYRHRT